LQKLVLLVAMLALLLAVSVPALATGNNQNAQSWVVFGGKGGSEVVFITEGDGSGWLLESNDISQTAESGDFTSSRVFSD
jgi:hypothetical protein